MKNKIKLSRVTLNLGQTELANQAGISRQALHAIESGKYVPSTLLALKFSRILNKPVEELFELEEGD